MPELRFTITKRLKLHDAKSVSAFFANLKAALGPEGFKKVFPLMLTENGLASRPMGSWRPGRRPASYSPRYSSAIRTARTRRRRSRRPTASLGSGSPRAKGSSPEFHLVRDVPFAPSWPHSLPGQKQGPIGSQMKRLRKKRFIFFGNSSFSQNFHLVWELAKRKINFEKRLAIILKLFPRRETRIYSVVAYHVSLSRRRSRVQIPLDPPSAGVVQW